jgi:hypothetical protein
MFPVFKTNGKACLAIVPADVRPLTSASSCFPNLEMVICSVLSSAVHLLSTFSDFEVVYFEDNLFGGARVCHISNSHSSLSYLVVFDADPLLL